MALGLMGVGGFLLFQQISAENQLGDEIASLYATLNDLNNQNPNPGNEKVDNIKFAREQTGQLRQYMHKARAYFEPIPPIPDTGGAKVSNAEFATQLRPTIVQLNRLAESQGVTIEKDYYFSFKSEQSSMAFDTNGLDKLAVQLGDIKAISEIILSARVSALERIRREPVVTNDTVASDLLPTERTVSTPLADISPFEVTFQCFSEQLAQVISKFANAPNGLIVKSINVEPVTTTGLTSGSGIGETMEPTPPPPTFQPPTFRPGGERGGRGFRGPQPPPITTPQPAYSKHKDFLSEKAFRVKLMIVAVKLKPEAKK